MNWQPEIKDAIRSLNDLNHFIQKNYLPHILSSNSPALYKEFFPSLEEDSPRGFIDPIGDHLHSKGGGVIHRYQNRILFSATKICPIHCRYCFRRNELDDDIFKPDFEKTLTYLRNHTDVNEVIFTGGDPLIL